MNSILSMEKIASNCPEFLQIDHELRELHAETRYKQWKNKHPMLAKLVKVIEVGSGAIVPKQLYKMHQRHKKTVKLNELENKAFHYLVQLRLKTQEN